MGRANGKELACQCRRRAPGWGRSSRGGHGNPLQYSCLENPMDRGAWWATVHRITESDTTEVIYHAHMLWLLSRDTAKYWLIHKVNFLLKLRIWTRQNAESSRSCQGHTGGCKLSSRKRNGVKWSQNAYLAHSNHLPKPPENEKQSRKKVLCSLDT